MFLLLADVATDMAQEKIWHHVAAYENVTWHTMCICACVCMGVCVRVCVRVRMCGINENKHPFQDFFYSH